MSQKAQTRRVFLPGSVRLAALVLTALTLCAALIARPARAAEWMTPYLEQVQEWGVMRGDSSGNLHEDRSITRAEFVTLVNRAFGYTEAGDNPFSDVAPNAWYAEDISIAHKAGYFNGTTPTTASPLSLVTREQAAVLLGRCLRLQGVSGAAGSSFTDVQDIGGWSRGLVQEAADLGIIQGYADGSFKPNLPITRGQMACFLVRALGTLVQEPGEQSSGGVYGNLTITTPGVKLKDTTVTGNLYLTGGVGLGNVELENVNVLGKIVVCGTGEAEKGEHSVILRNVTAGSLEVDSLTEQFLSIQAEGLTDIGAATVRTSAYLEDRTGDGLGFQTIRLDGVEGSQLQLAGNIKDVVTLTPNSALQIAQGVAKAVTVDERAENAAVTIDVDASVEELNLDRGTAVTGAGSISHLNVNAPGSNVSLLPDTIYVRPGITGNINKVNMDNKVAAESSEDPRLLAGYPKVKNIAPSSADAVFSANKAGTVHWAVTALMDGSLGEEELMNPGSYSKILRSGTVNAAAAKTEYTARLTGLTREGSYYVSALLVDARGRRSPVKVAAFTTPDDTAPNFASGYPQAPILTTDADGEQIAQIMVMPTKSCQMYYVLLPKGAAAPTAADFRSAALPGNLGYGVVTLRKNTPFLVSRINTSHLQEKTDYDLYLWLNDADNGKSSAVKKVTVTTRDLTPPTLTDLHVKSYSATTVTMAFTLDEPGTLSWAAAARDESIGVNKDNPDKFDQIKIEGITADGTRVVRKGGPVRAARGAAEYTFTISGLKPEMAYDLYYAVKDTAGNYSVYNKSIAFPYPIRTQDTNPPSAEHYLSRVEEESDGIRYILLDSDVGVDFSEIVKGYIKSGLVESEYDFHALYAKVLAASGEAKEKAKDDLASALRRCIGLYTGTPPSGKPSDMDLVPENTGDYTDEELAEMPEWINFREALVTREGGKTRIVFPAGTGVKLQSGGRYYFRVENIRDTSDTPNWMAATNITPYFATISARVHIHEVDNLENDEASGRPLTIFRMDPNEATAFAQDSARWDLILWAYSDIEYNLFVRRTGESDWFQLTEQPLSVISAGGRAYHSLYGALGARMIESGLFGMEEGHQGPPYLKDLTESLEFAILSTEGGQDGSVKMWAEIYKGTHAELQRIIRPNQGTDEIFNRLPAPLERISYNKDKKYYEFTVESDQFPEVTLEPGTLKAFATVVKFDVNLNLTGKVYCLAAPVTGGTDDNYTVAGGFYPRKTEGGALVPLNEIPKGLANETDADRLWVVEPAPSSISNPPRTTPPAVKRANTEEMAGNTTMTISSLEPERQYILYLVSTDKYNNPAKKVLCYRFTTTPPNPPIIDITPGGTSADIQFLDIQDDTIVPLESQMAQVLVRSDYFTGVPGNPFSKPMSEFLRPGASLPAEAADYTVLEAMQKSVASGLSVFDDCASDYAREHFREIITSTYNEEFHVNDTDWYHSPSCGNDINPTNPRGYTSKHLTFNLTDNNEYVLLVTAKGTNSDIYGFRASLPYQLPQTNYLTVRFRPTPDDLDADTYSGPLTISFSQSLRYLKNYPDTPGALRDRLEIDTCEMGHTKHAFDNVNHIGDNDKVNLFFARLGAGVKLTDPPMNRITDPGSANKHGETVTDYLTFDVTELRKGAPIIDLGSRIIGVSTSRRPGGDQGNLLTIYLDRDEATGQWKLGFDNGVDWTRQ